MQPPEKPPRKLAKQRTLNLIKSLDPDDDERTAVSKKISWILRHGASKVAVKVDADGWVKMSDLVKVEILEEVPEKTIMSVIIDSNQKKLRYQLKDTADGQLIKAYSKTERKALSDFGSAVTHRDSKATGGSREEQPAAASGLRQDAPVFVPGPAQPASPTGAFPGALPHMGYPWPFAFPPMMPFMQPQPFMPMGAEAGRYRGRIKSFSAEKGFGFIECPATYAQYNRDVFVHKAQIGSLVPGTEVTFLVETNKQGMPQAKDLAGPGGQPAGAASAAGAAAPPGSGKGKGRGRKGGKEGGKEGRGKGSRGRGKSSGEAGAAPVGKQQQQPQQQGDAPADSAPGDAAEAAPASEPAAAA